MTQALVVQNIEDVQYRDYTAGQVVDFPADILAWLKTRKLVDDTTSVVSAAISGGATQLVHIAGSAPPSSGLISLASGVWTYVPGLCQLVLSGTGAWTYDTKTESGVISSLVGRGVGSDVVPIYMGGATQIRVNFPNTITAKVN